MTNMYSNNNGVGSVVDLDLAAFAFEGHSTRVARAGEVQPCYTLSVKCRVTQDRCSGYHATVSCSDG